MITLEQIIRDINLQICFCKRGERVVMLPIKDESKLISCTFGIPFKLEKEYGKFIIKRGMKKKEILEMAKEFIKTYE